MPLMSLTIDVAPELMNPLQQLATERGESVSTIVEQLIADYLREQRHRLLLDEMERFRSRHAELCALGMFSTTIMTVAGCTLE